MHINTDSCVDFPAEVPGVSRSTLSAVNQCMPVVFTANLRGGFCTKFDELYVTLQHLDVDIACLIETWLNPAILANLTDFTGYTVEELLWLLRTTCRASYWTTCLSHH